MAFEHGETGPNIIWALQDQGPLKPASPLVPALDPSNSKLECGSEIDDLPKHVTLNPEP